MKSNTLAILILAYCILVACTRTSPNAQLVQADSLMQKFPDSALRFLQKIRPEELNSLEDRAYHALLLTEVKDKNFIQQTEDSQIRIAVQYYDSIKDIPMQAKSYYYLGCIWRDKDKHPEALKEFFKAITYSKKANDNKLTGYIYNNIANIYLSQRLHEQADSIYQITEKLAIQEKDSNLWADVLSQRGMIDINRGKKYYDEAEQKILTAFKISCHIAQKSMIAKTAYSLSLLYGRMNMGEKAVKFAKLNIINQDNPNVAYRDFFIRKACLFCMLTTFSVWLTAVALYIIRNNFEWRFSIRILFSMIAVSTICVIFWIQAKALVSSDKEKHFLKNKLSGLLNPITFQKLLALKPKVRTMIHPDIALHNSADSTKDRLMVVVNPNCKACAKVHRHIREISADISISLVIYTNDRLSVHIAQTILSAYLSEGWDRAIYLLEVWFEIQEIPDVEKYELNDTAQLLWRQQQEYCERNNISHTPAVVINGHYMPSVYQLEELKYLLVSSDNR